MDISAASSATEKPGRAGISALSENFPDTATLIEHLEELRKRIIYSLIAIGVGIAACFVFQNHVLQLLTIPLNGKELITLSPTESFMTVFRVAAYGGFIIASPVIFYQIWAFLRPALQSREKNVLLPAAIGTSLLFLIGVAFAWFMVLPRGLDFLLNYEADFFNQQLQATKYFSFVSMFVLSFGLIFEVPVMLVTLAWLGIVDAKMLAKKRRYALLLGAVISAVLTPGQDFFSMLAMFIPYILLYESSIICIRLMGRSSRSH